LTLATDNRKPGPLLAYAQVVRLPNLFTAAADPLMGALFVLPVAEPLNMWLLACVAVASVLLYAGGAALNDVFDAERDGRHRPERPIPAGSISLQAARSLGIGLLLGGVVLCLVASGLVGHIGPAVVGLLLAGCVVLYDAYAKTTLLGPATMGLCRMLNVLLGMSLGATPWQTQHWLVAAAVGVYIAGVTCFARKEAGESRRTALAGGLTVMLAGIAALAFLPSTSVELTPLLQAQPQRWYLMMVVLAMLTGWRFLRAVLDPRPALVQQAVVLGVLSLVLLDAAVVYAVRDMPTAVMVLLLVAPAMLLGRLVRMT